MTMAVADGTREAPIILDDDEDDDIMCAPGPSRLPLAQPLVVNSHLVMNGTKPSSSMTTGKTQKSSIMNYDRGSGVPQRMPGTANLPASLPQRQFESDVSFPVDSQLLPIKPQTLKRKRSFEDAQDRPSKPTYIAASYNVAESPDIFSGLSKKQRKRLRARLRAKEEARIGTVNQNWSSTELPPRPSYLAPSYASHHSPTPLPLPESRPTAVAQLPVKPMCTNLPTLPTRNGDAPLRSQPTDNMPSSLPVKPKSIPPAFLPIIGKYMAEESEFGTFPVSQDQYVPHDPSRTLVLEKIPKRFRTLDFVLQWCRDASGHPSDPAPLHVDVMRRLGKALVEFTTPEQARRAFHSPKLFSEDGRGQICAFWFQPEGSVHVGSRTPAPLPLNNISSLPPLPLHVPRHSSSITPRSIPELPRYAPLRVSPGPSYPSYSQPIRFLPISESSTFLSDPPSKAQALFRNSYLHSRSDAASYPFDLEEDRRQELPDAEKEEGEIEEVGISDEHPPRRNNGVESIASSSSCQEYATLLPGPNTQARQRSLTEDHHSSPIQVWQNKLEPDWREQIMQLLPSEHGSLADLIVSSVPMSRGQSQDDQLHLSGHEKSIAVDREDNIERLPEESPSIQPLANSVPCISGDGRTSSPSSPILGEGGIPYESPSKQPSISSQTKLAPQMSPADRSIASPEARARQRSNGSLDSDRRAKTSLDKRKNRRSKACREKILLKHDAYVERIKRFERENKLGDATDIEMSVIPTPNQDDLGPSPLENPNSLSSLTTAVLVDVPVEKESKSSEPDQCGLVSVIVPEENEAEKMDFTPVDVPPDVENQDTSEKRLAELRQRVLASKRQKLAKSETISLPAVSVSSANETERGNTVDSRADSTLALAKSPVTLLSSDMSMAVSSVSSNTGSALPRTTSYFDNMATVFLSEILGPANSDTTSTPDTDSVGPSSGHATPKCLLQKKYKRLEEHLAKSKLFLSQWEATEDKSEKKKIMLLIKEEKRSFEADKAAADAELKLEVKEIEAAKATPMPSRPTALSKRRSSVRWPQTRPDQMVIPLSDSEDDDCSSGGDG